MNEATLIVSQPKLTQTILFYLNSLVAIWLRLVFLDRTYPTLLLVSDIFAITFASEANLEIICKSNLLFICLVEGLTANWGRTAKKI